jgi:hypothetical protein
MVVQIATPTTYAINPDEIREAFSLFAKDGQIIELRAVDAALHSDRLPYDKPRIIAGWFDNVDALVAALPQIASAGGIYITINPCQPALLGRVNNRLKDKKIAATTDQQIVKRQYLLLDADPEREGHVTGIPSNDREHQISLDFIETVCRALKALGWPDPIKIDSGNGGYLIYPIDLPADDNGLVERVLKGIAQRFDTDQVHFDLTTFNQSRISRLPGTWNCKGDGTEDRPHRLARLLSAPEMTHPVSVKLLEAIAVPVEQDQDQQKQEQRSTDKNTSGKKRGKNTLSAKDFLEKHELATISESPYKGGTRYLLAECPFCHESDHNACVYDTPYTDPYIGFSCSHNRCNGLKGGDLWQLFETSDENQKKPSATVLLTEIADTAHLICTPSGALFARVPVNGHHEIVSINEKGSGFKRWLVFKFKREYGYVPNADASSQVMAGVQAEAEFAGERAEVYTRMAAKDECIYLDMANDQWQCIEISHDGWRVITCPPVYFRRPNGMLPLPTPTTGGSLNDLKDLINAKDDRDYTLITAWLVGTLHPFGPYPVLDLNGERGSTKSKTTSVLRNVVDPNIAPTRSSPKDDRSAAIAAQNNMIVAFDNLSSIPLWFSDLLCRIATGSGHAERELWTNDGECVFHETRPIIMNGIEDGIITQGDLLNRTMMVTLTPPDVYRTNEEIDALFKEKHPGLLGALLTVASVALRNRKSVDFGKPPRMADFAKWIVAAEPALGWKPGTFMEIYAENQESATSIIVESSPVAKAIIQFMASNKRLTGDDEWDGRVSDLHDELLHYDVYKDSKTAPKGANKLGGHIVRIIASMRVQGISIDKPPRTNQGSKVKISIIAPVNPDPGKQGSSVGTDAKSVGTDAKSVGTDAKSVGTDAKSVSSFSVPTHLGDPPDTQIENENIENSVGSVGTERVLSSFYLTDGTEKKKKEREKERERERNSSTPESTGKVPTLPTLLTPPLSEVQEQSDTQEADITDLLSEYRTLYQRIREVPADTLAPLGELHWRVPDSGFETELVTPRTYVVRLLMMGKSGDLRKIRAGLEEMRRKLSGMQ